MLHANIRKEKKRNMIDEKKINKEALLQVIHGLIASISMCLCGVLICVHAYKCVYACVCVCVVLDVIY